MTLDVIRTAVGLHGARDAWDALCDVAPGTTPFQRPAWINAWCAHFAQESPRVLALREGGDLVGLLPAFVREAGGTRTLTLLGAGVADHLDALAAPGYAHATLDAVREWLESSRYAWTTCVFDEVGPRALLRELRAPAGTRATIEPREVCAVLRGNGESDIERVVPRAQLGRARRAHERARGLGAVQLTRTDDAWEDALRTLHALQAKRWELCREAGTLGDARARAMHADVLGEFARRGALRVYRLMLAGKTAALTVGLREATRICLYLQASDPSFERAAPGTILTGFAIADGLAEGARDIDFLRGASSSAYAWGAMDEAGARVRIADVAEEHPQPF